MRDVYKAQEEEGLENFLEMEELEKDRYKVGCDMVLLEIFPEVEMAGSIVLPGGRKFLKADKALIRAVGENVNDYKVGEVAVIAPGQGGALWDGGRLFRAMPQTLIIAIDNKLSNKPWKEAWELHSKDVAEKLSKYDGNKLDSEKI